MFFDYLVEHNRYLNVIGIFVILGCAWLLSHKRSAINFRLVASGLLMQFVIAISVLKTSLGHDIVDAISSGITKLYTFAQAGSSFVFGNLTNPSGSWGFIFAFDVLPIIVFFGALMALLFHFGIIQLMVQAISLVVRPILGTSGAETLCAVANSFLGQTESPLVIRHYLEKMTHSEMLVVMVSGMATVSGSILVVYATMGIPAQHLLVASVMAVPGSIIIAKMLYPETERAQTARGAHVAFDKSTSSMLGSISQGTTDGLLLALNVGAMLIAFLALIALANSVLEYMGYMLNIILFKFGSMRELPPINLNLFFSYIFAPFAYLLGFTGSQALVVGDILGTKLTVNELVAYGQMLKSSLPERTVAILTYALCGFANFSSIGIQLGGIGALIPSRKAMLSDLAFLALVGGSLSNLLSACIAALLL
jgi:CNT family concentrative nucleoside transporter